MYIETRANDRLWIFATSRKRLSFLGPNCSFYKWLLVKDHKSTTATFFDLKNVRCALNWLLHKCFNTYDIIKDDMLTNQWRQKELTIRDPGLLWVWSNPFEKWKSLHRVRFSCVSSLVGGEPEDKTRKNIFKVLLPLAFRHPLIGIIGILFHVL